MIVRDYCHFGGKHWESAALRNMLAYAGVVAPHTQEPLTEALCFGIAGGIAAGYSFCPSVTRRNCVSGVSVVGRHEACSTQPSFYKDALTRLGASVTIAETGGLKAAFKNLCEPLDSGKPVVVWGSTHKFPHHLRWPGTYGMYSAVVYGIDETKGEAYLGDRAPGPITMSLRDLSFTRSSICSHKNRTLYFDAPQTLPLSRLSSAILAGIFACTDDFLSPRHKTVNLPGLYEWSRVIARRNHRKGWTRVFPGGSLFRPLRDVFDSIETAGTGGSLFRPLYAEFLDEAAGITGRPMLYRCANQYRELGVLWSKLANSVLPGKIKPFGRVKQLMRRRCRLFEEKGLCAAPASARAARELREIEKELLGDFPLTERESLQMLKSLSVRIHDLWIKETEAAVSLRKAIS